MVRAERDMAVKWLSSVGVWGVLGAILPIYKADSPLWISVLMAVVSVVAIAVAFKLVGIEYPEKLRKKSVDSDEGMNPVVMTGAAVVLADGESTDSSHVTSPESGSGSGSSAAFSSSSYDSGSSSSSD